MRASRLAVVIILVLIAACSSSSTTSSVSDAGAGGDAGSASSLTFTALTDCLTQPLTVGADGLVSARVFVVLGAGAACKDASISDADATAVSALQKVGVAAGATVCEVPQAKPADYVNGSCVQSTKPGFCYVAPFDPPAADGGAGKHCDQSILFSAPLSLAKVTAEYLAL